MLEHWKNRDRGEIVEELTALLGRDDWESSFMISSLGEKLTYAAAEEMVRQKVDAYGRGGTCYSEEIARGLIRDTMRKYAVSISGWLSSGSGNLRLDAAAEENIGYVMVKDEVDGSYHKIDTNLFRVSFLCSYNRRAKYGFFVLEIEPFDAAHPLEETATYRNFIRHNSYTSYV